MTTPSSPHPITIIPRPEKITRRAGVFVLLPSIRIIAPAELAGVARQLRDTLHRSTGWQPALVAPTETGAAHRTSSVILARYPSLQHLGGEGYRLDAEPTFVRIESQTAAGIFYGVQTLLQLLPPAIFGQAPRCDVSWSIPCILIEDTPRFSWRGAMLDCCRHFRPVAFVKKFIDLLALHKMNTFHWHLTDDQGWRIEIKKHPRLTEVGAFRDETMWGHYYAHAGGDGIAHGGFYTQEQIREVVAYAAERFVTIVPEIEMPGHARAAIAAYPELGSSDKPVSVGTQWGIIEEIFNPSENTLRFLQDVLDEVMELFPGQFIHVGGDEAVKTQWQNNLAIGSRMKELGLTNADAMQSYFIRRMGLHLSKRGRRLIGWDEILDGGDLPAGAVPIAWRDPSNALRAMHAGHDVVVAWHKRTYLDYYQTADVSGEPLAIGGYLPLSDVYHYNPVPPEIEATDDARRILGVQAQLWGEYIKSTDHVEYMAFPRLCALAEVAWLPVADKDYPCFSKRLGTHLKRLDILGVRYRPPSPCGE